MKYYYGDKFKGDDMGGVHRTSLRGEKSI